LETSQKFKTFLTESFFLAKVKCTQKT